MKIKSSVYKVLFLYIYIYLFLFLSVLQRGIIRIQADSKVGLWVESEVAGFFVFSHIRKRMMGYFRLEKREKILWKYEENPQLRILPIIRYICSFIALHKYVVYHTIKVWLWLPAKKLPKAMKKWIWVNCPISNRLPSGVELRKGIYMRMVKWTCYLSASFMTAFSCSLCI